MFKNAKVIGANIDPEIYHRRDPEIKRGDPAYIMSQGELKEFARCPARWRAGYKDGEQEDTKSQEWGTLIDCLLLTPNRFDTCFAIAPETYPAEGKKKGDPMVDKPWNWNSTYCKEWREAQNGKRVIKYEDMKEGNTAISSLLQDQIISSLIMSSEKQVMVTAEYRGIPLRILIDLLPPASTQCLADLKTARSAAQRPWKRQSFDFGYHWQAAFYLDIYNAATGENRTDFKHIVQENFSPYQTGRRMLSIELIESGRQSYQNALKLYADCLELNVWPDYDTNEDNIDGWTIVQPEAWMIAE